MTERLVIGRRILASRLRALFGRARRDRELDEEIALHLELSTEDGVRRGLSRKEARLAASATFGGVLRTTEAFREQRGLPFVDSLWQDIRHAARGVAKRPWLAAVAAISIGFGVGINVTTYGALRRTLVDGLTATSPDRLLAIGPKFSYPNYLSLRRSGVFAGLAATEAATLVWRTDRSTVLLGARSVSANFFDVLGVQAKYGRTFTDRRASPDIHTVVLAFDFWRRQLGGDPAALGRTMNLDGWPHVVVGVLSPEFYAPVGPMVTPDVFVTASAETTVAFDDRAAGHFDLIGRLHEDATNEQTVAALIAAVTRLERDFPAAYSGLAPLVSTSPVNGIDQWRGGPGGWRILSAGAAIYALAALMFVIACTNVAGLLLAGADERRRELVLRVALGASRRRLVQQCLTEAFVITTLGTAAGIGLYVAAAYALTHLSALRAGGVHVAFPSLPAVYCLALAFGVNACCGLAPALMIDRQAREDSLRMSRIGPPRRGWHARGLLVIGQVAICSLFLIGTSVLLQRLLPLEARDPGFDVAHTLAVRVQRPATDPGAASAQAFDRVSRIIRALPAVESVTCVRDLPFSILDGWHAAVRLDDAARDRTLLIDVHPVGPDYLRTMQIPVLRGRDFGDADLRSDSADRTPAIINETFARAYFASADPIGSSLAVDKGVNRGGAARVRVVGVARDTTLHSLAERSRPVLYVPEASTSFVVRVKGAATAAVPALERSISEAEPGAAVHAQTLSEQRASAMLPPRIGAVASAAVGLIALVMPMTGVYGVISHAVSRRRLEIGLRMAVGASPASIVRMVLADGLALSGMGVTIGVLTCLLLMRVSGSLVAADLGRVDPVIILGVVALILVVCVMATLWPACRASRVDPMIALRCE